MKTNLASENALLRQRASKVFSVGHHLRPPADSVHSQLHRVLQLLIEGHRRVLPKRQVDQGEHVNRHGREDDDPNQHCDRLGEAAVDDPRHEARAQVVDVDADDAQPKDPGHHDYLKSKSLS